MTNFRQKNDVKKPDSTTVHGQKIIRIIKIKVSVSNSPWTKNIRDGEKLSRGGKNLVGQTKVVSKERSTLRGPGGVPI